MMNVCEPITLSSKSKLVREDAIKVTAHNEATEKKK